MGTRVRRFFKVFIFIFLFLTIGLPLIIYFALKIPAVQKFAKDKTTYLLSKKIKSKVSLTDINLSFPKGISLRNIYVEDRKGDTLLYANELVVSLDFLKLFKKELAISKIKIEDAKVMVNRGSGQVDYNYTFIEKAFADSNEVESAWTFDIDKIDIKKLAVKYQDQPGGIKFNSLFKTLSINITDLGIENHHLLIDKIKGDGILVSINFQKPEVIPKPSLAKGNKWKLTLNKLSLSGSGFEYNDYTKKQLSKGFDVNRLNFSSINTMLEKISIRDTIQLSVKSFSAKDKNGLIVNELEGKINLSPSQLSVELNVVKTPHTDLHNQLNVSLPLSEKIDIGQIAAKGDFKNEVIAIKDLNYFIPDLDTVKVLKNKKLIISGKLSGKLNDFQISNASLSLDKQNYFKGDVKVKGFPDFKISYFDLKVKELKVQSAIAASFIDQSTTKINLDKLSNISASGTLKGSLSNLATRLAVKTNIGNISVNGKFITDKAFTRKDFTGELALSKFNLGKLLKKENEFGILSIKTKVKGNINSLENFNANVSEFEFKKYTYKNFNLSGSIIKDKIAGTLKIDDKNLKADLKISTDLKDASYQLKGTIQNADLYKMNLNKSPLVISTKIDADLKGSSIDSMEGVAHLTDILLSDEKQKFEIETISIQSNISGELHNITISSSLGQAKIDGVFLPSELPKVFTYLSQKYFPTYFGSLQPKNFKTENFSFKVNSENLTLLTKILIPDMQLEMDSLSLNGEVSIKNDLLNLNSNIGNISIKGNKMSDFSLNASGEGDRLSFMLKGQNISIGKNFNIDQPLISGRLQKNTIDFNIKLYNQKAPTRLNLDGILSLGKDSLSLTFPDADIFIKGHEWILNKINSLVYSNKFLEVKNLELKEGEQKIFVNSKGQQLEALIHKVKLEEIAELTGADSYKVKGMINGQLNVTSENEITANIKIDSFYFSDQKVGDLSLNAYKPSNTDRINIDLGLNGNDAEVKGYYYLNEEKNIDLNINLSSLPLHSLEPFVKDFIFRLRGIASGNLHLSGKASSPDLTGILRFKGRNEIGLTISNTIYKFNDQSITFKEDAILFDQFTFTDSLQDPAIINGAIYHKGLNNLNFALKFDTDKFELVNSAYGLNKSIYGKLLARLHVGLSGPIEDLKIKMHAETLKGTNLFVTMNTTNANTGAPAYVHFAPIEPVNVIDSAGNLKVPVNIISNISKSKFNFSKFKIDGSLKITKVAEINLIIDPVNGDKITANGEGNFTFRFDSDNNLNLFGMYTIDKGSYDFSFALLKRKFEIESGSTINWTGEPLGATLNITSIYKTKASRYPLIQNQVDFMTGEQIDAARRLLPIEVQLKLTGDLLTPDIAFDIKEPEGVDPLNGFVVTQEINRLKNNPNELNKQVFSLILANRFTSPNNSILGDNGTSPGVNQINSSVSSLLNSQLNQLAQGVGSVDLNIDIESLNRSYGSAAQNVKVMAKKQLNTRITVGIGGNYNINNTNGTNQLAGDYNVFYRLNKKGTVNLKYFRTSFQNLYASTVYVGQGLSVTYRREFERWKYFFKDPKKQKI